MHAISSYRGNRPTNKHTNRQGQLQYTALQLSAQCNIMVAVIYTELLDAEQARNYYYYYYYYYVKVMFAHSYGENNHKLQTSGGSPS